MKEKNKKLIIVVASLLVVIGVSFAYFAATTIFSGNGASVSGTTAIIGGSELKVEGSLSFNDLDIYPGHSNVSSIKLTATGENEFIPYNIIWEGTNTLNTSLNYTVYKTDTSMNVSASCDKRQEVVDGALRYYEECSISNVDSLGSIIASGTIHTNETKVTLIPDEFITSSEEGEEVYYYVVLEYPNIDENQNSDIGGTFTGEVTIEENDASPDITIIGTYIEENGNYKETSNIPSEGYELNTEKSTCSNNATLGWDSSNNRVYVENLNTSGTECTLYYDEVILASDIILGNVTINEGTPDFSQVATTDEGVWTAEDNLGTSYYFRGAVTNNYVQFAGYYWRIIRINGDGSIRMIYDGTAAHANGESSADRQIDTSVFNNRYSYGSYYVGYTYEENLQRPSTQNGGTASAIKGVLDRWYTTIITDQGLDDRVVSTPGFCNDRNIASGYNWVASGTTFDYAAKERLYTNKTPTLKCSNTIDLYTTKVGLITADEVSMAGGVYTTRNNDYYLYIDRSYWTITPAYFYSIMGRPSVFTVDQTGFLTYPDVSLSCGVRPVINLRADVTISSGNGTMNNPYVVS